MNLDRKASLLGGQDMWTLPAAPEIGLPSLVTSDGPIGVRGARWMAGDPALALPSPTALGRHVGRRPGPPGRGGRWPPSAAARACTCCWPPR